MGDLSLPPMLCGGGRTLENTRPSRLSGRAAPRYAEHLENHVRREQRNTYISRCTRAKIIQHHRPDLKTQVIGHSHVLKYLIGSHGTKWIIVRYKIGGWTGER